jgi:AraC-like DNA-binding protein
VVIHPENSPRNLPDSTFQIPTLSYSKEGIGASRSQQILAVRPPENAYNLKRGLLKGSQFVRQFTVARPPNLQAIVVPGVGAAVLMKQRLCDPKCTIIDAGLDAGFENPSHFARVFHRFVGTTPSRFRAEHLLRDFPEGRFP